jgi:hypothetical protein
VFCKFLGNALAGAELLLHMRELPDGFLEQKFAEAEVKCPIDVHEQHGGKQQNCAAVSPKQERFINRRWSTRKKPAAMNRIAVMKKTLVTTKNSY